MTICERNRRYDAWVDRLNAQFRTPRRKAVQAVGALKRRLKRATKPMQVMILHEKLEIAQRELARIEANCP